MKFKIFFSSLIKKCFICFFIFLSIVIVSANATKGEVSSTSEIKQVSNAKNSNTVVVDLPPESFSFQGVKDIQSPVKVKLKDNKVDLSSVTTSLNRATESLYDNLHEITETIQTTYEEIVDFLCIKAKSKAACMDDSAEKLNGIYHDIQARMSKEILYPYWYEEKDQDFSEALNLLNAGCATDCGDYTIAASITRSSDSKYHQLYDQIKNKDKKCQIDILQRMVDALHFYRFPRECMEEENKNQPVCKDMFKHVKAAKNRFLELVRLTYGEDALTKTEAQAICVECASAESAIMTLRNNPILDAIKIAQRSFQCRNLKLNEEKRVYSGTGLSTSYNVKREMDGSYSIPLILKFSPGEDYNGVVSRSKVPKYYMRKVQACMAHVNQKMLGPNGEQLKINIMPDSAKHSKKNCNRQEVINIKIGSSSVRSNMINYASDINCPTITHEVLHLLGLLDEYKEAKAGFYVNSKTGEQESRVLSDKKENTQLMKDKDYKFKKAFDCRVTQINSIMSNKYIRWDNVYQGNRESLLDPGHFNSILYGDCAINQHFNECSQLSYQYSNLDPTCMKKKQQCESKNILKRDKQKELARIQKQMDEVKQDIYVAKRYIIKDQSVRASAENIVVESTTGAVHWGPVDLTPEDYSGFINFVNSTLDRSNNHLSSLKEELQIVQSWSNP